jgi:diketogulonate reductase-like aldo/keto reductase
MKYRDSEEQLVRMVSWKTSPLLPALGLGTWHLGESTRHRAAEVRAVRLAIEMGYRLFDTAEMYGEGGAEQVLGQAVAEALRAGDVARDDLFIVSKVYPHNASTKGTGAACARSLQRLGLEHIDLYLLHWPGEHPLAHTVAAFEALKHAGNIVHWGVSNFDVDGMSALLQIEAGGECACNQVSYSLAERGPEFDLLPQLRQAGIPLMAYCPVAQGALANDGKLASLSKSLNLSAAQLALAWVIAQPGVTAIPKAVKDAHLRDNFAVHDTVLDANTLAALDALYPPPRRRKPLAMV